MIKFIMLNWRPSSLSELTPILIMGLTHLDSETSNYSFNDYFDHISYVITFKKIDMYYKLLHYI